jgi:hypothetical protein
MGKIAHLPFQTPFMIIGSWITMLLIFLSHHRWECCVNFPVRQVRKCDDVPSDWLAVMGSGYEANWHPDTEYRETWWNLARVLHFSAYDIIRQFKHVLVFSGQSPISSTIWCSKLLGSDTFEARLLLSVLEACYVDYLIQQCFSVLSALLKPDC